MFFLLLGVSRKSFIHIDIFFWPFEVATGQICIVYLGNQDSRLCPSDELLCKIYSPFSPALVSSSFLDAKMLRRVNL